jgi:YbbR domain-containing protein
MPFQDIEDIDATPVPRRPTPAERWLRKVFLEDWGLKLLALAITVVLWLAVTGQNKPMTMHVSGVPLNFLRPEGLEISNDPPGTIDVILTGSRDKLDRIGSRDLVATVDLSDQKPGERILKLTPDRVRIDLQEDVKIEGFRPGSVPIRLEPIIELPLDVEVKFEGKLPEGFEVASVSVSPTKIRVLGPADRVNALRKALTETVWLDGRKENFNLSRVEINIPEPKIEILDPVVDIHVELAERKRGDLHLRFATRDATPYLAGLIKPAFRQ